jgi:hypothetical protein
MKERGGVQSLKKNLQIALLVAILLAALRTGYTLYERHAETVEQTRKQPPPLNPDYYVVPKKLHPYDLKSAKQLTEQPVWVKVGYSSTYYRYDPKSHHVDFAHEVGQLLPIEELKIKDVVSEVAPSAPDQRQVMATFEKDGKTYAFSIGSVKDDTYRIYSDDMLYIQDPHELYRYWRPDIWAAIDQHEVRTGMNELQADFAIGLGIPEGSGDSEEKTVHYSNGGKRLSVTYRKGKAVQVLPAS